MRSRLPHSRRRLPRRNRRCRGEQPRYRRRDRFARHGPHLCATAPLLIDVVSSDALQATGKGNLLDALQSLLPSFNSAAKQSDLEGNIPGVQLRNLRRATRWCWWSRLRRTVRIRASVRSRASLNTDLSLIPVSIDGSTWKYCVMARRPSTARCDRRRVQRHSRRRCTQRGVGVEYGVL